jgi:hypothetical protein
VVFAVFVSLLLASLTAAQDKRSSLLNKRAGNRNIFQKTTTTTTEANYEVSFAMDFWELMIEKLLGIHFGWEMLEDLLRNVKQTSRNSSDFEETLQDVKTFNTQLPLSG